MKMQDKYYPKYSFPIADWHKWYAWRPVYTVDRGWCWLVFVHKRPCQVKHIYIAGGKVWWQYVAKLSI